MNEETIFAEALALPAAERAAYLDAVCAGQPELRQRIEALLQAHDASSLLNPPAADPDATGDAATADYHPAIEPGMVIAGRYTLVQKIGEGGMGEVWLAKQTEPVKRKVALKLIKAGLDSRAVVARFENERQALAMMDHPNIARVLEGGLTPSGQPFFVMELVNGLALSKFCDQARLSLRERLELFVPICQAVHHAHYKGIVHRDLKPANILVTLIDARPVPKVIDFGVAKATGGKLTDESLATQFGAIVGTLEYLSPEQAGYSGLDIDTRADIYSLGVILYELLTGLRPIDAKRLKKTAFTEMIRIIHEEEPSKPSTRLSTDEALPSLAALRQTEPKKLMALLRGELDWVVMKCLEKQRERRYTTANSLAAEIQRYLADEAVEARPPSAAYRMSKFLKRHKGPVLAASLLLLALLGGIAGTTWGLIRADRARAAEAERVTERDAALTKLTASKDELLSSVARSLFRPLAVQVRPNQPLPPLNDQEVEALWDLASSKDERLRLRFVEVALQDPVSTRRFKDRAGFALQAAVGLNGTRRIQIEELLGKRLQANEVLPEQQVDVALCLAHLGLLGRPLAGKTAATLTQTMTKTTEPEALKHLSQDLLAVAYRLEPKAAGEDAATLTQTMSKTTDLNALAVLGQGLSAVATHMESKEAAEAALTISQAMSKTTESGALNVLAQGLSAVASRLEPKVAARACGQAAITLTQAMSETTDRVGLQILAPSLVSVSSRLEPKEAAEAAATLTQAMSKTTESRVLEHLSEGLSTLASRLEPKEAIRECGKAAFTLTQAMSKTKEWIALVDLAMGLLAVAPHLERQEASQRCGQVAVNLTMAISKMDPASPAYQEAMMSIPQCLSALTSRLEPKEATDSIATLTQAMSNTTEPNALYHFSQAISEMASRLKPKEAAQACSGVAIILTLAMSKTTEPNALGYLTEGLSAVALRMEAKEAVQRCGHAAAALSQAMSKTTDPPTLRFLSQGLSAAALRMEAKEAAQTCGLAAVTLTQTMSKTTDGNGFEHLVEGLSAVVPYIEAKEAAEAATTLTRAMSRTTNRDALEYLARGLSVMASRLEPKEAVAILTLAMTKKLEPYSFYYFPRGLSAVASRLKPNEAAEAVATLTQAMNTTTNPGALSDLAQGLSAVASRLEPKVASQVCSQAAVTLIQAMSKTTEWYALRNLAKGLSAVVSRLEPKVAAETIAILMKAMSKRQLVQLPYLADGLSMVASRLEAKEVALTSGQAAVILIQAMSETKDPSDLRSPLEEGLSWVLSGQSSTTLRERYTSVTGTIATFGGLGLPFTPLALAQRALEPLAPPLPPQTLVDILKQPFCVGEARRLVLEQLSRHYHRPFADQWEFVDYVHQHKLALDFTTPP